MLPSHVDEVGSLGHRSKIECNKEVRFFICGLTTKNLHFCVLIRTNIHVVMSTQATQMQAVSLTTKKMYAFSHVN